MKFSLGNVDAGAMPANKSDFLSRYHAALADGLKRKQQFRDESNGTWSAFREVGGTGIRSLQQFLKDAGFMPKSNVDGIFGYATQASVRLFQEYIRTVQGNTSIGTPDGIVGPNTLAHVERWKKENTGVCHWGKSSAETPSPAFKQWINLIENAQKHFLENPSPIREHIEQYAKPTDTLKINDLDTSPNTIHLIGLRTGQDRAADRRENDDLFVLLINGMVFKFWGSTDPNPGMASRADIPFLVEGQHRYQFGWHKISDAKTVYRALRPASHGVLVFRDRNGDRALTDSDILKGVDPTPNTTINIHWSGIGTTNFSAGCQVIAGRTYINDQDTLVNCGGFAATSYSELGSKKTRGAYNVFTDLLLTYAPPNVQTIAYMLGRDVTLRLSKDWTADYVQETVDKMRKV